jgi:MATE family multidrug resistance protein
MTIYKREIASLLKIALPLVAAVLAQNGMQLIDTIMMGWLGSTALAAGALGSALYIAIVLFCMGVLSAVGIFIVRAKVLDHSSAINLNLQHGIYLACLLAIPCMLIIWFIPYALLRMGEDPAVIKDVVLLLHGLVWGFPGSLLFVVLREFVSAFSLTFIIMTISMLAVPLTFLVNYILIYGKYHFPALGIAGIGYGAATVNWLMFLALLAYSIKHVAIKDHILVKQFKFNAIIFSDMIYMGIPSGLLFLLEAGMFLATALLMGYFGVAALAAHQIALSCVNIAYTLPFGLAMATALQIGHAVAAKNLVQAKRIAIISLSIVLVTSACIAVIFSLSSNLLVNLFLANKSNHFQEVHQFATTFINIAVFFLCFDALQSVANGALRGSKDTLVPMLLSIGCYWMLGVGSAYYLSMYTHFGASGIWYGLTLGLGSTAIMLMSRFFRKLKTGMSVLALSHPMPVI